MELLDRYLQAIKTFLTGKDQDDILQELRESLLSQMEEKERALGRALTADEVASIIRENGPPYIVATRFGPHRSLIGPTLFPFYWLALKWGLVVGLIIQLIIAAIRVIVNSDTSQIFAIPQNLFMVLAWTTISFAAIEFLLSFASVKFKKINWNPKSLPKLRNETKAVARSESVAAIIFGAAGLVWLRHLPGSLFMAGQPDLVFAPVWSTMYQLFIVLAVAGIAQAVVMLVNPYLAMFNQCSKALMNAAALVGFYLLLRGGPWVSVANTSSNRPHWEALAATLNQVFYYIFLGSVVMLAAGLAWNLYSIARRVARRRTLPLSVASVS